VLEVGVGVRMKMKLGSAGLAVAGLVFAASLVLPVTLVSAESWRVERVDDSMSLNLRKTPSNRAKIIGYIPVGTKQLSGGKCAKGWCPVEYEGVKGWVFQKYLKPDNSPEELAEVATPQKIEHPVKEMPRVLRLAPNDHPTPVYAFPNEKLPIAGLIPPDTDLVERIGPCMENWCYIKSGSLIGWLQGGALAKPLWGTAKSQNTQAEADTKTRSLNTTETTAHATPLLDPEVVGTTSESGNKLYGLAGLTGDPSLPMRERPEDGAPIITFIPEDARDIEGLHKCAGKWCLVRYQHREGWVQRRHLADETLEKNQAFQVDGVALWSALDVFDAPGENAAIIGRIPAYATGVVPIGSCERTWCHIRYLGIAGWVNKQFLAPLAVR
jgi:SH3-like domain-containing protein